MNHNTQESDAPALVMKVMEAVCILLGAKPDWDSAKKVLGDVNLMERLETFDKDHIKPKVIAEITKCVPLSMAATSPGPAFSPALESPPAHPPWAHLPCLAGTTTSPTSCRRWSRRSRSRAARSASG